MRPIRTLLIATTALALVTVGAAGVAAQTSSTEPASFVGWVLDETHVDSGTSEDLGDVLERRQLAYSYEFESADPRMIGSALWTANGDRYRAEPLFELQTSDWVITNDAGTWVGTGTGLRGTGVGDSTTMLLEGTGAYEGMSAYLVVEWALGGGFFRGAIFPGAIPDVPAR